MNGNMNPGGGIAIFECVLISNLSNVDPDRGELTIKTGRVLSVPPSMAYTFFSL